MEKEITIKLKIRFEIEEPERVEIKKKVYKAGETYNFDHKYDIRGPVVGDIKNISTKEFARQQRHEYEMIGEKHGVFLPVRAGVQKRILKFKDSHKEKPLNTRKKLARIECINCGRHTYGWRITQKYCSRQCYKGGMPTT